MVTIDAGVAPGLAYDRLHFEIPRTLFNYAGHGGLGMGLAVGLGTKRGRPDRTAVSLQGDGASSTRPRRSTRRCAGAFRWSASC